MVLQFIIIHKLKRIGRLKSAYIRNEGIAIKYMDMFASVCWACVVTVYNFEASSVLLFVRITVAPQVQLVTIYI